MKVLVVDDSLTFRSQIKNALSNHASIEVVGTSVNGQDALDKIVGGLDVDLITLDLEMPKLTGLQFLAKLSELGIKKKVIVFSATTKKGSEDTLAAMRLGALDFVTKPSGDGLTIETAAQRIRDELQPKILQFLQDTTVASKIEKPQAKTVKKQIQTFYPTMVVIGSSTGGPMALAKLFSGIEGQLKVPICIVQHMPPLFTATLAEQIMRITGIEAKEASNGEPLENKIYVAPGDFHLNIKENGGKKFLELNQLEKRNSVRPAVDFLFESASEIYKDKLLGVVLTGMGEDGLDGCRRIKEKNGGVMIQNKESCVVFGMPGAVFQAELHDSISDIDEMKKHIRRMCLL